MLVPEVHGLHLLLVATVEQPVLEQLESQWQCLAQVVAVEPEALERVQRQQVLGLFLVLAATAVRLWASLEQQVELEQVVQEQGVQEQWCMVPAATAVQQVALPLLVHWGLPPGLALPLALVATVVQQVQQLCL